MSHRTLVLGAGFVGRAAAWDLSRRGHEVVVADSDGDASAAVGSEFDIASAKLDVDDQIGLDSAARDADSIVSAVPYRFGVQLAKTAVKHGCHYYDLGGNPRIVKDQLGLDDEAQASDVAIVPDCGLAPGLANVIASGMIEHHEGQVEDVQLRVGVLPQEPEGVLEYQLAFYAGGLINEYAEPCEIIADGAAATVDPLTRIEEFEWDGLGTLEAFSTAGGTSTMCEVYEGAVRSLEYKTIRYPGHGRIFAAMREIGLFDMDAQDFGSANVAPREVLIELLTKNLPSGPDRTLVNVVVSGTGGRAEARIDDVHDGRFSSLARTTGFPTTALCDLVARGLVDFRGAAAMHSVAPAGLLGTELKQVGIAIEYS